MRHLWGNALDTALMVSTIGLFKTELIDSQRSWTRPGRARTGGRRLGPLVQLRSVGIHVNQSVVTRAEGVMLHG